jgi:hypothetical protein
MEHQPSNSRRTEEEEAVLGGDSLVFAPSPLTPFDEKQSFN